MPRYHISGSYALYHLFSDNRAEVSGSIVAHDAWSAQAAIANVVGLGERFIASPYDLTVFDENARPLLVWRAGVCHREGDPP